MSGCLLIVPALAGGSIAVEREKDTLEQLSLTLIRPTGLLAAKLVNAAGLFVLMVLGAMPVVATVFFSVGLDWRELAAALILVLSAAVLSGAVGLMCSAFFRRPVVALIASYLGTIMINGGPFAFLRVLAMTIYMMIGTGNGMFRGGTVPRSAVCRLPTQEPQRPPLQRLQRLSPHRGRGGDRWPWRLCV